ncbi:MAG: DEAD/DEAH box helicase family protein [Gemmataceae bacterium]
MSQSHIINENADVRFVLSFQPGTFEFIEQKIRNEGVGTDFGTDFEWLCKFFLSTAPKYKGVFKTVWLWKDWPGRWGIDKGIDLVAETLDAKFWAIQSKSVRADRTIPKSELDSFLSESNRPQFAYRLIIATTDDIGRNARDTIAGQEKPVGLVLRGDLLAAELEWPTRIGNQPPLLPAKKPRPHQSAAIENVLRGFANHKRGQLIMACGTGKTLTALWIAENLDTKRILVLVPSLSLISQTMSEWGRNAAQPFDYLVVCSDETVVNRGQDVAITFTGELGVPVTTDVDTIRRFLRKRRAKSAVVFATYQSTERVAAAQRSSVPAFDLVLADEAHRCTGHAAGLFTTVLDASKIKARRRLFMTATPRYFTGRVKKRAEELEYELASMDDEARFGPVFHQLAFDAAIRADLLTDYQVVVIGVTQAEIRRMAEEGRLVRTKDGILTDARTLAAQIGLAKAMGQHDLRKIITFHSSVAKASRFTDPAIADSLIGVIQRMSPDSKPSGQLWTAHISGHTPAGRRSTLLNVFGKLTADSRGVLSNCACLGEGVDVPVLDGVAFIDPKRSMVDIIQAVGRVIRKAEDKRIGTVVIPVFVDESEDADHALSNSAFEPVWQVLKALRAHDQQLANELDELRLRLGERSPYGGKIRLPQKIKVDVPTLVLNDFEQSFYVRTVEETTRKPALTEEWICERARVHFRQTGKWPSAHSGELIDAAGETWSGINSALSKGGRNLPGDRTLAKLLQKHFGVRNLKNLPEHTEQWIRDRASYHYEKMKEWPSPKSGALLDHQEETWSGIDVALFQGNRGLPGGSSLPRFLEENFQVRNRLNPQKLSAEWILERAKFHHEKTNKWPNVNSGKLLDSPGEIWANIHQALSKGIRGCPGGSSLARFLEESLGVRNPKNLPKITEEWICERAKFHRARTGNWPNSKSGKLLNASGETWANINARLHQGGRGLPGGSSLIQLLEKSFGVRNTLNLPRITEEWLFERASFHLEKTGKWPNSKSGELLDAPAETWGNINYSLRKGLRGLPGQSSLAQLIMHRQISSTS